MDTAVRSMLSYTRLLPYELLREIFLYYLEAAARLYPTPKLLPPLLLGQICSTWRHVVHSTPKLWTRFSLDIGNKVKEGRVDHVSFAKAWLSRAHPYPLDISLRVRTKALNHIMDAILPCADRLRVIDLHLPFPDFQPLVDAGSMALLESVNLSVTSNYGQDPTFWVRRITAFTTAPRLHSVTISSHRWALLHSCRGGLFGSGIQMPWSQLTELHINEGCESADTFRDAFLQCTNLVNCTLIMCTWEGGMVIPDVPTVVLSHLRKLEVTFSGTGHSFPFFQPLNLPALKDLTVATRNYCAWSHQIFMGFTLRSSLDLERLSFKEVEIRSHELLEFLRHMHSLVELEIEFSRCVDDDVFDALCYREMDSQHLIPKLEILRFFEAWHNPIDDDCVANTIESRWWTDNAPRMVSRLKRVDIVYDSEGIDSRVWERLEHCRQEGLVLNLHWVQDSP